jgi:hypothetical protein
MATSTKQLAITVSVLNGKLNPSFGQKAAIAGYLQSLKGTAIRVTFSKPTTRRSNNQNAYYWAVVVDILASETGNDP